MGDTADMIQWRERYVGRKDRLDMETHVAIAVEVLVTRANI